MLTYQKNENKDPYYFFTFLINIKLVIIILI